MTEQSDKSFLDLLPLLNCLCKFSQWTWCLGLSSLENGSMHYFFFFFPSLKTVISVCSKVVVGYHMNFWSHHICKPLHPGEGFFLQIWHHTSTSRCDQWQTQSSQTITEVGSAFVFNQDPVSDFYQVRKKTKNPTIILTPPCMTTIISKARHRAWKKGFGHKDFSYMR